MKRLLLLMIAISPWAANAQKLPVLKHDGYVPYEYSVAESKIWEKAIDDYRNNDYNDLDETGKMLVDSLEMGYAPLTEGPGCSWYCGGGPYKVTASSFKSNADSLYVPDNAHDFNVLTSWVPAGNPPGAKLNFHFEPRSPRIHTIKIYNGYLKNTDLWQKNSRAKKLKLYIDGTPKALLELDDLPGMQSFGIDPIRSEIDGKDLVLTLEVLEIYPGSKYTDLAITEVNFDGLDVHCFGAGTKVLMWDGTKKAIEQVVHGDIVASWDFPAKEFTKAKVDRLITTRHRMVRLIATGREIITTADHPFWAEGKGWVSLDPEKSNADYIQEIPVKQLAVGDRLFIPEENRYITLEDTEILDSQVAYTLELNDSENFIANGFVVKTEIVLPEE